MSFVDRISRRCFVPRGAAFFEVPDTRPPQDIHFLILPRFTMLALSSTIAPLRIANQLSRKELYRWHIVAEGEAAESSCDMKLARHLGLDHLPPRPEIVICSGTEPQEAASPGVMRALRGALRSGGSLGAICSGAFTLARLGLLDGKRFTLHWENRDSFHELFPDLTSSSRIYEIDGRVMTCGGGQAATDMMLARIAGDYGPGFAAVVGDMCLHGAPRRQSTDQRSSIAFMAGSRNPKLVRAIEIMQANLETGMNLDAIAGEVGCSRRQLERLFNRAFAMTPARYYRQLRLDYGHRLLVETNISPMGAAMAAGFVSLPHFSRCFRERFGATPSKIGGAEMFNMTHNRDNHT